MSGTKLWGITGEKENHILHLKGGNILVWGVPLTFKQKKS